MAQRDTNVTVPAGATWTLLTNSADNLTTAARVQNKGALMLELGASANTSTTPANNGATIFLAPLDILPSTQTFAQLWPGLTAPAHIWGRCSAECFVSISHA